jgi:acyl-CoA synthetase (AMP-forming)/AMP-acid ligase II/1-acyl-sn-glycerol-3-phosphate acyltransferase/acyl carrier protein
MCRRRVAKGQPNAEQPRSRKRNLLDVLLRWMIRGLLRLRYDITVRGFEELRPYDGRGILFLPNHPALVEPIIMMVTLLRRFSVGVVADRAQVDRPVIAWLARRVNAKTIKDPGKERDAKGQIERLLSEVSDGLNRGESYLLYPAGRVYRQKFEDLGANSAVETLLRACPNVRVVLVRTHGLWGSAFSRAAGGPPQVGAVLKRGVLALLVSGIFFAPRRKVTLDFHEPADLPHQADRNTINRYLECFYNDGAPGNTYVPYSIWERGGVRQRPEPDQTLGARQSIVVPQATRRIVEEHLREVTGVRELEPGLRLATDLGLDSLARVELQAWIEAEFGFSQSDGDALDTVGDVFHAACGEATRGVRMDLEPVDPRWFEAARDGKLDVAEGETITQAFLDAASRRPDQVILADQNSGAKTYRDLVLGIYVLRTEIAAFEGDYVGILMPATVAAAVAYLATLFAGKIPVMLNWTTGPRGVEHAVEHLGITRVLSARPLIARLSTEGFSDSQALLSRVFYLDEVAQGLSLSRKLRAALRARFNWAPLRRAAVPDTAVVLFTSGSESVPKAVPLTHTNILTNDRDVLRHIELTGRDALLSMLPPFHSFGLTVDLVLPLLTGVRAVFHSNPTESAKLANLVEAYGATLVVGTPTFLGGIVSAARAGQLQSVRLAVTGAEQCPPRVYDAFAERCPQATLLEGYGITECSPVVSVNLPGRERRGTIGEVLSSVEWVVVDPESMRVLPAGTRGMLLVRGPTVFSGYLDYDGPSPFVEHAGKQWYRTGDLVSADEQGILTFLGRLKRFIKLGGEMISLPAVEAVLERAFPQHGEEGPALAVEPTPGEHPELVLFATFDVERDVVNRTLREAGLSPLHNIRRIERVDQIPVLGTGKTDYRSLRALIETRV